MTALATARGLLEKRRFPQALVPLLAAWAETRSPQIAAFVARTRARFTRAALPLGGSYQKKQERWLALATRRDSADVPRLLAALNDATEDQISERLAVLTAFPPDPLIAAEADGRALTTDEEVLITAIATLLDDAGEALLAAIHADPYDDGRRAVYADWLLEQNDPHGELINLQLAGANAEMQAFKLERRLTGPLIYKISRERGIRRGFLDRVVIANATARSLEASTTAPEWATVSTIVLEMRIAPEWFAKPHVKNLRELRGAKANVAALLREQGPALAVLGIAADTGYIADLVANPGRLAGLTTLALEDMIVPFPELATSPLRLQRLEVITLLTRIAAWLDAIATTTITELVITNDPQIYCLREPGGRWEIEIPRVDWSAALAGNLAAGLAGVDAAITIARTDERYHTHVVKALGDRVTYR